DVHIMDKRSHCGQKTNVRPRTCQACIPSTCQDLSDLLDPGLAIDPRAATAPSDRNAGRADAKVIQKAQGHAVRREWPPRQRPRAAGAPGRARAPRAGMPPARERFWRAPLVDNLLDSIG